jgi:D-alanyl-D-alanine carboxypeptidase (penicillin-binding protein 5/6)
MNKSIQNTAVGRKEKNKRYLFIFLIAVCCLLPAVSFAGEIRSRAAVALDVSTGKTLYAKNPDLRCAPASTTKLMTAIVAIENADFKDVITVSRKASLVPPHKAGFKAGDKVTVEKLLYAALIGSANDAAVALAEGVAGSEAEFVELMNRKAAAIGARNTRFINSNGLPGPGQYTTASDLSKIMNYALRYPKLREIIGIRVAEISTQSGKTIFLKNTNRLLWSDEELVGGKTGYTRKARHCFVCAAERDKDTVIVAILGSPSRDELWKESETLIGKGFEVKGNRESPVVYVTQINSDSFDSEKASFKKKSKIKGHRSKIHKGKGYIAKKAGKHKKATALAKSKCKAKIYAKCKSTKRKNYRVAKKGAIERSEG